MNFNVTNVPIQAGFTKETPKSEQNHYNRSDYVTITISRSDAEFLTAMTDFDGNEYDLPYLARIEAAARAALEGER